MRPVGDKRKQRQRQDRAVNAGRTEDRESGARKIDRNIGKNNRSRWHNRGGRHFNETIRQQRLRMRVASDGLENLRRLDDNSQGGPAVLRRDSAKGAEDDILKRSGRARGLQHHRKIQQRRRTDADLAGTPAKVGRASPRGTDLRKG